MAFNSARTDDFRLPGSGEIYGDTHIILSNRTFEDNLIPGRFAKIDSGRLDNLDSSANPVIAGVVRRRVANSIEDGNAFDAQLFDDSMSYVRLGLTTVDAVAGQTPTFGDAVTASNTDDANRGMATVETATGDFVATNAEFIQAVDTNVWLVLLR